MFQFRAPEVADRLEIRELVDAYAHCADRRDGRGKFPFLLRTHTSLYSWMLDPETINGIEPTRRSGARI